MKPEPILEPQLPIIDAHHHLWSNPPRLGPRVELVYLADELDADLGSGHRIVGTVFVECRSHYREAGPAALRPVGETEFVVDQAGSIDRPGACAGIVGFADLLLGTEVRPVLEAHIEAAAGRFRGIRHSLARDDDPIFAHLPHPAPETMRDGRFRAGLAELAPLDLAFDAMVFHPQLPMLGELAAAFPDTRIVLNHVGGMIGIGAFASRRGEAVTSLRAELSRLASLPNLVVKLGGMGMFLGGSPLLDRDPEPSVEEIAEDWGEVIHHAIDCFGPDRCMFESNFPVDRATCSYARLWNVFKRLAERYTEAERAMLFAGVAARVYRLEHLLAPCTRTAAGGAVSPL